MTTILQCIPCSSLTFSFVHFVRPVHHQFHAGAGACLALGKLVSGDSTPTSQNELFVLFSPSPMMMATGCIMTTQYLPLAMRRGNGSME